MKTIGIVLLLLGVLFLALGIISISKLKKTKIDEYKDNGSEKLYKYTKKKDYLKRSIGLTGYGIIFFIVGIVFIYLFWSAPF